MRPLGLLTGPMSGLKPLIHRLSGAAGPAADEAGAVFRTFADHVERRLADGPTTAPKIRLAGRDERGGPRTWP